MWEISVVLRPSVLGVGFFCLSAGMVALVKPSLADSFKRRSVLATCRTSPARPISPKKMVSAGRGWLDRALINAAATARSAAGSLILMPPAMFRNIS